MLIKTLLSVSLLLTVNPAYADNSSLNLSGENLFPEGITYREKTKTFYVGSAGNGSIQTLSLDGKANIIQKGNTDGRKKALGVKVDELHDRLLVADGGNSVYIYSLKNNKLIKKASVPKISGMKDSSLNDIAIDNSGNAYVTDSFNPYLFKINTKNLEMSVFRKLDKIPFGEQNKMKYNLNGIVITPDQKSLIAVKTNDGALWKIDIDKNNVSEIKLSEPVTKGDGLVWGKNNNLFIIRNYENKISKITFTKNSKLTTVESFLPENVKTPTTGAFIADKNILAVVNSQFAEKTPKAPFTVTLIKLK